MHGQGNQCNQDTEKENFLRDAEAAHTGHEEETREKRGEKEVEREGEHRTSRKHGFRRLLKRKIASFIHNGLFDLKKQKASNVNGEEAPTSTHDIPTCHLDHPKQELPQNTPFTQATTPTNYGEHQGPHNPAQILDSYTPC